MLLNVYVLFDSKVEAFMQPFFLHSKGEAIRAFSDLANDVKTQVGKYPADFTLFHLGTFDSVDAKFDLLATPMSLGLAIEFVKVS